MHELIYMCKEEVEDERENEEEVKWNWELIKEKEILE